MYLKSIEMQGFKSFANKITLSFHNGITGIVGPNGSGKSNVADAVRWVLGEQKIKTLRGASMQDVIFSGTELRKPLGFAYVAITLDNSDHELPLDYDEVTVSRRLYRSGESEYMINGSICRLKDIYETFYDTGIGKEGYSIIGQGQIDQILSGKPEERRELFDEAAGIVKFKRRKAAAQKKLEDDEQALLRISDILGEQERQLGPLEKQAEKAHIYLNKRDELKTLDVNAFLLDNRHVKEMLDSVSEKLAIAVENYNATNEKLENSKVEYDEIQSQLEVLEEEIEEQRKTATESSVLRGKLEGQINVLKEQIKSAEQNREHQLKRRETLSSQIEEKQKEKEAKLSEKKVIDDELSKVRETRDSLKAQLEELQMQIEELNNRIEEGKNAIIEALNERATTKSKLGRYDSMFEQANIDKASLTSKLIRVRSDEAEAASNIKALEENFEKINEEIRTLDQQQKDLDQEVHDLRQKLTDLDVELQKTREAYHQAKSKLDALENITERYEGYGNSVKMVMEQKKKEKGIIGVVADIIKVEEKYETAIETALGGNIQNVVTEDEATAKRMIEFLKKNRFGRATFLPLTSIEHPQEFKTPEVLKEKGVIGMANEIVKIDKKYVNVAKAMLGRIVVVDTMDNALKIARKFDYGIRMVTLEGELLIPGGAISGGAFKNNSNLLGRRREINELEENVTRLGDKVQEIEQSIKDTREKRNELRMEAEKVRLVLQNKFIEQNTARISLTQAQEKQEESASGLDDLKKQELEIEKRIQEIQDNKDSVLMELEASENLEKETKANIEEWQKQLEGMHEEEQAQASVVAEQDVEVEKILQKQEFEQVNVDRIDGELQVLIDEKTEIVDSLDNAEVNVAQKKADIEQIQETIAASTEAQGTAETKLQEDLAQKEELSAKQKHFFDERDQLTQELMALDKEQNRLTGQKEKYEASIESQIEYMWNEYEITLSDAASMRNEELNDLSAMKRDINRLKDEIRKLGDVNVNAIEEFRELNERHTQMKTQHDDIVEARETMKQLITELDTKMREQFAEKFKDITREFDVVFKELFGGGKASLALVEGEDILEAGIIINGQPPGKKLQNMMQMSGGEKALTAISLLFAIQNLKPSPFCLLDEIEAALDENNVSRFAGYLHKLTKNTQFIVITHRRGTMEKADRLYGITMQEKGVSTLVSVDLIDKDLDD
ncbi:MAG: chromosome segregation protein SMC [Lachnospiraceae bacterium]|nr:chromosome segregation protein SMC [Lachnospiraceae bacterium]